MRLGDHRLPRAATQGLVVVAASLHLAALVSYTSQFGVLPLSGLAPALSSLAFLLGLLAVGLLWLTGEVSILLLALPLILAPLGLALLAGFGAAPTAPPWGGWFLLHTALSLLGLALLGVAFVAAALYLMQHRELKARRFGVIFQFVPSLEQLDRLNHLALVVGFPALTLGIVLALGSLFGGVAGFTRNPVHLGWGLLAWVLLGVIAGLRLAGRLRGKRAASWTAGAFGVVVVTYLILLALLGRDGTRFL